MAVVVTRYFGGTLLGTGGLVRAYSKAVQEGLKNSVIIEKQEGIRLRVQTDYTDIGKIQYPLFVLSLCSCSIQIFTDGKHQESSSATTSSSSSEGNSSEAPSTPEISNRSDISISDSTADSPSATPDVISSSTSSSDSNESPSDTQVSPDTYTLTRYDSIYDVPYAKLDYKSYVEEDGDSGHYTLTKDGIPWVGTPGTDQFGDICFSDRRNLYIQCFLSYNDTLSTDFRWFCVNFNHFDDEDSYFLPDETMNKLFTGADGETLYTDDGYQYKLSTMPWCQDGTCKR